MPQDSPEITQAKVQVLLGTRDKGSPLAVLDGKKDILKQIFDPVDRWRKLKGSIIHDTTALIALGDEIVWPEPRGLNINMMPFYRAGRFELDASLPEECKPYRRIIEQICSLRNAPTIARVRLRNALPEIAYLTIHEGPVRAGESQRRPGLHTETPGYIKYQHQPLDEDSGEVMFASWGRGAWFEGQLPIDGIYMASNVANSCRAWDVQIDKPEEVVGPGGDIEDLREHLGEGRVMEPNRLYWMTDTTPHESLPLEKDAHRQYIRVVMGKVSAWYADHSTRNPMGVEPDAIILKGNKFEGALHAHHS